MVYFMFYVVGILFFIFFIFLTLIFYKYLYKVCEKLNININKNILCVISIIIFYGSLVVGMMNKYVSVVLVFILYTILLFLVVMLFYNFLNHQVLQIRHYNSKYYHDILFYINDMLMN